MLELAFWIAIAVAASGAVMREHDRLFGSADRKPNRAAWVMLASVALCLYLDYAGVPFNLVRWLIFDTTAMTLIVLTGMTRANWLILALFPVGWAFYLLPDPFRYQGSIAVTTLQLLLTFPAASVRERLRRIRHTPDRWNEFDLRAAHGEAGG